jgi:cytochrome c-type biogenesis protein CcmE
MSKRSERKIMVVMALLGMAIATTLFLYMLEEDILYYKSPTEIKNGEAPEGRKFRAGGLVVNGSVKRATESLLVKFDVTDNNESISVEYSGILPDLFREGQGIIAIGEFNDRGVFVADEVLAKHDENYMPPEVADALKATENR